MQNNQHFPVPATHVFQNKTAAAIFTVPQVASNNGGGTQSLTPINGGTAPDPVCGLHHTGAVIISSQYSVQKKYLFDHHNNDVYDPELSSFISELQKDWNLNYLVIVYTTGLTMSVPL